LLHLTYRCAHDAGRSYVFERMTDRARRSIVLAQEQARELCHNYVGTEHLLLGLIEEGEGVAAKALVGLGISLVKVQESVETIIGRGAERPTSHIPFTPRAKKVIELSLREALQLGHNYIGTEHILLGLIREGEGVGSQVLVQHGAELTRVRQQVIKLLTMSGLSKQWSDAMNPTEVRVAETGTEISDKLALAMEQIATANKHIMAAMHTISGIGDLLK
jgi:ATP-dependent Clp protease ATP-binding subunit ClpC